MVGCVPVLNAPDIVTGIWCDQMKIAPYLIIHFRKPSICVKTTAKLANVANVAKDAKDDLCCERRVGLQCCECPYLHVGADLIIPSSFQGITILSSFLRTLSALDTHGPYRVLH
jgi:hypothetical protein